MRCDIVEDEMEHAVIHCHPNFYTNNMFKTRSDSTSNYNSDTSKPWFDWLNVKWNDKNVYEQSAQLKLIALYENENIAHYDKKLMFIVQQLIKQNETAHILNVQDMSQPRLVKFKTNKDGSFILSDGVTEVVYRGKLIATEQETQEYKITKDLYFYE